MKAVTRRAKVTWAAAGGAASGEGGWAGLRAARSPFSVGDEVAMVP